MSPRSMTSFAARHGGENRRQNPTCSTRPRLARELAQLRRLGDVERQRLLAQHVQPGVQRRLDDRRVRRRRGGDEARLEPWMGERAGRRRAYGRGLRTCMAARRGHRVGGRLGQGDDVDLGDVGEGGEVESTHPAEADDGDPDRRGDTAGERTARESVRPWTSGRTGARRRARRRAHRPDARRAARPPGAGRRRSAWSTTPNADAPSTSARRSACRSRASVERAARQRPTSTPWPSARAPTPTSTCSSPRRRRARRSSARSRSRSTSPRSTGRWPRSTTPAPACRSASTAGSIRPTGSSATPSPPARSAPSTSCASPAATRPRRRSRTSRCPAGSSST